MLTPFSMRMRGSYSREDDIAQYHADHRENALDHQNAGRQLDIFSEQAR